MLKIPPRSFIPFVTAGHPDLETTEALVKGLARLGSAVVEIGIPFSDPIADGPIIQKASFEALEHGYTMEDYLELVARVRKESDVGLIFMTYMNPVLRFGLERLDDRAREVGLDGILISDLTPEEYLRDDTTAPAFRHLKTVFLAAPTSSDERIARICDASSGFVYAVARTGVTGRQTAIGDALEKTVRRIRRCTELPVAVGFGIRSSSDVERVWKIADAAIVGSAIVDSVSENREAADRVERVLDFVERQFLAGL